jgi:hypothetical protein
VLLSTRKLETESFLRESMLELSMLEKVNVEKHSNKESEKTMHLREKQKRRVRRFAPKEFQFNQEKLISLILQRQP